MQGEKIVIEYLNKLLGGELSARDQYFIHANMFDEWGFTKLAQHYNHEMEEETKHAQEIIKRILLLESTPNLLIDQLNIAHDTVSMLKSDLDLELRVRENLKEGIYICEKYQDYVSRNILVAQLKDTEEDHAHWLEQQLRLITSMGLANYLQSMQ